MIPLATDGATAATVRYVQIPRLQEMNIVPSVVTITIGASDLSRLAFGDVANVCRELREHGTAFLAALRTLAPNAVLLCSTLYDPMDGSNAALTTGVQQFNDTLRELIPTYCGIITKTYDSFAGHGASVGDPLSPVTLPEKQGLYFGVGADLIPVPNADGVSVYAALLFADYCDALTEETPLVSNLTIVGEPL